MTPLTEPMTHALILTARLGGTALLSRNNMSDPSPWLPDVRENTIAGLETRGFLKCEWRKASYFPHGKILERFTLTPKGWHMYAGWLSEQPNPFYDRMLKVALRFVMVSWLAHLETEWTGNVAPKHLFAARYCISPTEWGFDLSWYPYGSTFRFVLYAGNLVIQRITDTTGKLGRYHVEMTYWTHRKSGSYRWLEHFGHHPNSNADVQMLVDRLQKAQRIADALNADLARLDNRLDPYEMQILDENPAAVRLDEMGWPVFPAEYFLDAPEVTPRGWRTESGEHWTDGETPIIEDYNGGGWDGNRDDRHVDYGAPYDDDFQDYK